MGERGQIVIPKEMRDKEGLQPEDRVKLIDLNGEIIIQVEKEDKTPEVRILELLKKARFAEKDWQAVLKERQKE